jgi:hypothetical protein
VRAHFHERNINTATNLDVSKYAHASDPIGHFQFCDTVSIICDRFGREVCNGVPVRQIYICICNEVFTSAYFRGETLRWCYFKMFSHSVWRYEWDSGSYARASVRMWAKLQTVRSVVGFLSKTWISLKYMQLIYSKWRGKLIFFKLQYGRIGYWYTIETI